MLLNYKTERYFFKWLLILILTFSSACFFNYYTPVMGNLSEDELIGIWKPTDDSLAYLRKENICCEDKEIKLTLSADKNFVLTNIPDCWRNDFGECKGVTFSYKGMWSIYKRYNTDNWLHLAVKEGSQRGIYAVPLIKRKGKIQIVFVFGDPDEGREIYLTKE